MDIQSEADLVRLKKAKKSNVLRQDEWEPLINGEVSENQLFSKLLPEESQREAEAIGNFAERDVLHVAIDRMAGKTLELGGKGQLFYTEELFINDGGLYFLVDGDMALIEPALRYLEHVGFGGDISIGKGKCKVQIEDFHLRIPEHPTHMVTLSLYRPTQQELSYYRQNKDRFWYDLVVRSGKLSPSLAFGTAAPPEKSSVVVFAEGSTFPWLSQQTYGSVQPVAQVGTTNALFNGFALMIPARFKEEP